MILLEWLTLIFLAALMIPPIVYCAVKFGTVGYYKGRQFVRDNQERKRNG